MSISLEYIAEKNLTNKRLSSGTCKEIRLTVTKWIAWGNVAEFEFSMFLGDHVVCIQRAIVAVLGSKVTSYSQERYEYRKKSRISGGSS